MPASAKGLIAAAACLALIAATAGGISAVTRHRNETAVFEDRTSRIISGNIAADDSAAASVEAPSPSPSPEASGAQGAEAYSAAPRLSDSENYGYVPGRGTETAKTPAVTATPDYSKFPTFTPAPGLVPTPTPTTTAVPTPVPTATPDAAQFAAPEESTIPVETPVPTVTPGMDAIDETLIDITPTATPAPADNGNAASGSEGDAPLLPPVVEDEAAEKIVRRIDLTSIDAGELVKALLMPQMPEADDDAQGGDAASTEAADASDASAADAPEATPAPTATPIATPTPTPAATPEASNAEGASDSGDDERPPVVSAPEAIDDALKAVLPAGIGFDKVDVIRCIHPDAEATLIVCISGDEVLVLSYDAEGNILSTLPDLDAHQYAALIDPYIVQATQAAPAAD